MEYSIQEVARAAGTTSRTLRHYDSIGLVHPSRIGRNGYRHYDDRALVRLQRVLLLRQLGLGLDAIGEVLAAQDAQAGAGEHPAAAEARILSSHLELLTRERREIEARIGAVERTVAALRREAAGARAAAGARGADPQGVDSAGAGSVGAGSGSVGAGSPTSAGTDSDGPEMTIEEEGDLMSQNMFDGFDHTQYREEVEQRWGADAYAKSDRWWRGMSADEQRAWQERVARLSAEWTAAAERGEDTAGAVAQDLARRHVEWLRGIPQTPAWEETQGASASGSVRPRSQRASTIDGGLAGYVRGLGEMYVADERFAANYGGTEGATFVRDALAIYVDEHLG
ncbi:MAG: MerR family transcriptional regulator [Leucobacter sp.]